MRDLGLPVAQPWYPLLSAPVVALRHRLTRLLPGGRARLVARGRRAQASYLAELFGPESPELAAI